ncbi:MAG: hypothetical protein IH905_12200 [Proteobacteria bacterium]|nr:hypothetical protein [Pseudomonadota bacterium]
MAKDRVTPRVSTTTWRYLEDLMGTGLYGTTIDGVARTLIEAGIREAIGKSHIGVRQIEPEEPEAD